MTQAFDLPRRLAAEALGACLLVATVVGSGVMAESLSRDVGVQLLGNTLPTGAILVVLITIFGPISGAHFNPAVSLVFAWSGALPRRELGPYMAAQVFGAVCGAVAAHMMFGLGVIEFSAKARAGAGLLFAEWIATFGLLLTILAGLRFNHGAIPWLVGLYITAAYWFTASTSFANPAVAIARSLTPTFSGIRPIDAPAFIVAQIAGAFAAAALCRWLLTPVADARPAREGGKDAGKLAA